ncbi:MAG: HxlR family transcriptional regulator [Puniceicoccaceae bacterium 5H]|nr:MAG: HxlR family transcriptional regulator [Puniceicoccaceae bacterium 5H]
MASTDYSQKIDPLREQCAVKATLDVIRGRWKPLILWELSQGVQRFSDLQAELSGVTAQALTVQLRQLEADGVVKRTVYPEVPVRVEYELTPEGGQLSGVMAELEKWGIGYLKRQGVARAAECMRGSGEHLS